MEKCTQRRSPHAFALLQFEMTWQLATDEKRAEAAERGQLDTFRYDASLSQICFEVIVLATSRTPLLTTDDPNSATHIYASGPTAFCHTRESHVRHNQQGAPCAQKLR